MPVKIESVSCYDFKGFTQDNWGGDWVRKRIFVPKNNPNIIYCAIFPDKKAPENQYEIINLLTGEKTIANDVSDTNYFVVNNFVLGKK